MDNFSDDSSDTYASVDGNELEWLDDLCLGAPGQWKLSVCQACEHFLRERKQAGREYKQLQFLSTFRINFINGCRLCALLWNKIQKDTTEVEGAQEINLRYMLDDSSIVEDLELWASYQLHAITNESGTTTRFSDGACTVITLADIKGRWAIVFLLSPQYNCSLSDRTFDPRT